MSPTSAPYVKRALNAAIANFKAMPSAFHFRALERAMLAYQEASMLEAAL